MRNMTMTLADDKKYKFRTLTRKQVGAVKHKQENADHAQELRELEKVEDEEGLTAKEQERMTELHELEEVLILEMIRMSMTPAQPDWALTEDPKKEAKLNDELQGLLDMRDMGICSNFAMVGTLPVEEAQVLDNSDIDLTK